MSHENKRELTLRKIVTYQTYNFSALVWPDRQAKNATFGTSLAFQMSVLEKLERVKNQFCGPLPPIKYPLRKIKFDFKLL